MALTESLEYDKMEIVTQWKHVQVRQATVVKKDGVEIARSFHRYVLTPGTLDDSDNLVNTDISGQPTDIQGVCNALWTDAVKSSWKTRLIQQKSE
tara:strand:- start:52 stop:336 length:285 start_codon:yes stop_codon:yes gene_type:complete